MYRLVLLSDNVLSLLRCLKTITLEGKERIILMQIFCSPGWKQNHHVHENSTPQRGGIYSPPRESLFESETCEMRISHFVCVSLTREGDGKLLEILFGRAFLWFPNEDVNEPANSRGLSAIGRGARPSDTYRRKLTFDRETNWFTDCNAFDLIPKKWIIGTSSSRWIVKTVLNYGAKSLGWCRRLDF